MWFSYRILAKWLIYFKNWFEIQTIRNNPDFSVFGILNQQWQHRECKNLWGVTDSTITCRETFNDAWSWNINYILLLINLIFKWKFLFKLPVIPVAVVGIAEEREEINNKVSCQYLHSVPKNRFVKKKLYCRWNKMQPELKPTWTYQNVFLFRFRAFPQCGSKFRTNILLLYSLNKYLYTFFLLFSVTRLLKHTV